MGLYEQIRDIAKAKGYSINRLEHELGFARSSINKFNKNKPSADKLQQIADFLGTSMECLMDSSDNKQFVCKECGHSYYMTSNRDNMEHDKRHFAWQRAVDKFGPLFCYYPENERIKAENRVIAGDASLPLCKRLDAQIEVLRCLFSRSVEANEFDLRHVPFDTYVAMMLGNPWYRANYLDDALYQALADRYSVLPGIGYGTIYHIPEPEYAKPNNIVADNIATYVVSPTATVSATMSDQLHGRDLKQELDSILKVLDAGKTSSAIYRGHPLDADAAQLLRADLETAMKRLEVLNKAKHPYDSRFDAG